MLHAEREPAMKSGLPRARAGLGAFTKEAGGCWPGLWCRWSTPADPAAGCPFIILKIEKAEVSKILELSSPTN